MKRSWVVGWRLSYLIIAMFGVALLVPAAQAAAISQGFKANDQLSQGMLVGLDPAAQDTVRPSNANRSNELIGVVVSANNALLAISDSNTQVQVVTSGQATTLVSSMAGDIKKGDPITASPINGVGQKAITAGRVLGLAQEDFTAKSAGAQQKDVDTGSGRQTVAVGAIQVMVSVGYYSATKGGAALVPQSVQNLTNTLAGREVSAIRIIIATIIFLTGLIFVVIILNSAVHSSLTSIGRNPLAKKAVSSGLIKVVVLTVLILLVTLGSVYFIIRV